jgi:hypothetical protein
MSNVSLNGVFVLKTKPKTTAAVVVILVFLVFSQSFLPISEGAPFNPTNDKDYWMGLARSAWQYFLPGKGVIAQTGLHSAGMGFPYFTEWDLGTHIQAIIDAREIGILPDDGEWGFNSRIEKILNFLQTRELTSNNNPYLWYDAWTGKPYGDTPSFCIDEGKLYMGLYNLKVIRPDLTEKVDYIVKVRNNNSDPNLVPDPTTWLQSTDFYTYYVASAFQAFGFEGWDSVPSAILNNINSQPKVTTYGMDLPKARICSEPLLLTKFELNPQDVGFDWLLTQTYLASEARYAVTGKYTAFSEGNTDLDDPSYVFEFVVDNDGSTWKVAPKPVTPIAFFKVAVSYQAIFGTGYADNMVEFIREKFPLSFNGFAEGVTEDGSRVDSLFIDRTNGLILSAARYAINNMPTYPSVPIPTPISTINPTPTATPSPTLNPTPISTPTPPTTVTPNPSTSVTPNSSATATPIPTQSQATPSPSPSPFSTPSAESTPSATFNPTPSPSNDPPTSFLTEPRTLLVLTLLIISGCIFLFPSITVHFKKLLKKS